MTSSQVPLLQVLVETNVFRALLEKEIIAYWVCLESA